MKKAIKERWLEALDGFYLRADGKPYMQGTGTLCKIKDGETYHCCLGVLTDLAVRDGVGEWVGDGDNLQFQHGETTDHEVLPTAVQEWAGLREENPVMVLDDGTEMSLIDLNDGGSSREPEDFSNIYQLIEEQIPAEDQ